MKISSNIIAEMVVSKLNIANKHAGTAMERLSSGSKINSAKDDPAGMAIANKLNKQATILRQANENAMDGISMAQTAEGALNEVHAMLNKMRELTIQGQNGTLKDEDKEKIQQQIDSLSDEIKNIGKNTEFNKKALLDITDKKLPIQIGTGSGQILEIDTNMINMKNVTDQINGIDIIADTNALEKIDKAVSEASKMRGYLGSIQNRLEHTVANLDVSEENTTSSLSRIQDADMAEEMTTYTQYNVITQAGISMLSQANQRPNQILQLLNS